MTERYGERPDTPETEPAPTITSKARTARWYDRRQGRTDAGGRRKMVRLVPDSEPAPMIGVESESRDRWIIDKQVSDGYDNTPRATDEPIPTLTSHTRKWRYVNGNQEHAAKRPLSEPAPTVHFGAAINDVKWTQKRPATTVAGDPRLGSPGHRDREGGERQFQPEAIQVTVTEAAILQSFPPDYPWQGSRTAKFTQIGNAIPPLLARAIIEALLATRDA